MEALWWALILFAVAFKVFIFSRGEGGKTDWVWFVWACLGYFVSPLFVILLFIFLLADIFCDKNSWLNRASDRIAYGKRKINTKPSTQKKHYTDQEIDDMIKNDPAVRDAVESVKKEHPILWKLSGLK